MDLNAVLLSGEDSTNDVSLYKCTECERGYTTLQDLLSHQGTHTGEYPYTCEYCHKGYKTKMNLVNHINLHLGEGHQCERCKKVFSSPFLLKQHKRWHVTEKSFVCKVCDKAFKVVESLRNHMKQEHSDKLYKCPCCRKKLCSDKSLQAHLKRHSFEKLKCAYCSCVYKSRESLRRHLTVHASTENLLTCHYCGFSYQHKDRLKRHIKLIHSKTPRHKCIYCGACKDSQEALHDHIAEHKKTKPGFCQICGGQLLRRHRHRDWPTEPNVSCPRCTAKFRYPANLLKHAHVHGDDPAELKWDCEVCGRCFMCHDQYKKHIAKPHSMSPGAVSTDLKCKSCCKPFKNSSDLKEHVKIHVDNVRKVSGLLCEDCGKLCTTLNKLNFHRRRHFNTNLFPCLYCSDVFNARAHLLLHMKAHFGYAGSYRCHWCDINYTKKTYYVSHLKYHCDIGDSVCMKCLIAFPTDDLYTSHNNSHSLPFKCSKCAEEFNNVEVHKNHVKKSHRCSKLFLCKRCNLGLLTAQGLEQHTESHAKEDATNAKKFRYNLYKSQKVNQSPTDHNVMEVPTLKLNTYCTCSVCNPPQSYCIDPEFDSVPMQSQKNIKIDAKCVKRYESNEPLTVLKVLEIASLPNASIASASPHPPPEVPISSRTQELQSLLMNASVKKVVLKLPAISSSNTKLNSTVVSQQNGHSALSTGIQKCQIAGYSTPNLKIVEDPNSTVVPEVTKNSRVTRMNTVEVTQLLPLGDVSVFHLFCELLMRILGPQHVLNLKYAIMEDGKAFLQSYLPGVEVNAMEIRTEDTVRLFIQSMVQLSGEEKDKRAIDYALNDLDLKSLVQEMLICVDGNSCKSELEIQDSC